MQKRQGTCPRREYRGFLNLDRVEYLGSSPAGMRFKDIPTSSRGGFLYVSTGKLPEIEELTKEELHEENIYLQLAQGIDQLFGEVGGSALDIHHAIGGPSGMSWEQTQEMVTKARKAGYIKVRL